MVATYCPVEPLSSFCLLVYILSLNCLVLCLREFLQCNFFKVYKHSNYVNVFILLQVYEYHDYIKICLQERYPFMSTIVVRLLSYRHPFVTPLVFSR